jgi:FtsH-binding integral membrane protein
MQFDYNKRSVHHASAFEQTLDLGLRSYMIKIYNYMFLGLASTGLVAYFTSTSQPLLMFLHGGFGWLLFFGLLGISFYLPMRLASMRTSTAQMLFWVFSLMMGLSLSYIFLLYTATSITRVFFITSAMFGAMSLYGYTTKNDLTGMGSFLTMGLFGIIIASIVNIFLKSSGLMFILSILGVLIFTGLTAYDTQRVKDLYYGNDTTEVAEKKAIMGAFILYLDFINLFLMLLRLLGNRRD